MAGSATVERSIRPKAVSHAADAGDGLKGLLDSSEMGERGGFMENAYPS